METLPCVPLDTLLGFVKCPPSVRGDQAFFSDSSKCVGEPEAIPRGTKGCKPMTSDRASACLHTTGDCSDTIPTEFVNLAMEKLIQEHRYPSRRARCEGVLLPFPI